MFKDLKNDIVRGGALTILITVMVLIYLLVNVLPFLFLQADRSYSFMLHFSLSPDFNIFLHHPWTLITYAFFHADVFHILFNMLGFYFFGDLLQSTIGKKHLLPVVLWGIVAGGFMFIAAHYTIPFFFYNSLPLIGFSAAILALMVSATLLMPNMRVTLYLIDIPLKYLALIFLLIDLCSVAGLNSGGHIAHLGGALAGWAYIKALQNGFNISAWLQFDFSKLKNRKKFQVHRNDNFVEKKVDAKKTNEEKLNKILEKISASGYESLSNDEKDFLKKYSNG